MSRSSESFTLLESGASRIHFKLAKELEEANSLHQQDTIILDTVAHLRKQLSSRSFSADVSKLASALVTLLHCLQHYPASTASLASQPTSIDASFALLPALQLLSLATGWKDLLIAHQLLPFLLPQSGKRRTKEETTSVSAGSSSPIPHSANDESSSLLLLNTFRADLSTALEDSQQHVPRHDMDKRSRSPSRSRSSSRAMVKDVLQPDPANMTSFRALACLKSLVTGTPRGPAVLPSLASTLVELTRHPDSSIRTMTLNAMLTCASIDASDSSDADGQAEILDAALTIVRLTLASTYAFSPGLNPDENQGMILAEMERRVDSSPNVLRACIKIVDHARASGIITSQEAACHAIEALQATRWVPMHLEVAALEQQRLAAAVAGRTEGLRARTAARQRPTLQAEHDYHGTYAPWLVDACLSSLTGSLASAFQHSSPPLDDAVKREVLKAVLRIYHVASQGKAAALALCVAAARCIGTLAPLSTTGTLTRPAVDRDEELAALWATLSAHVKSQLYSTNPNRKTASIVVLDALLPLGWAQGKSEANIVESTPDQEPPVASISPVDIAEPEMAQLMALLTDPDTSIRRRVLALLHRVDSGLADLLAASSGILDQEDLELVEEVADPERRLDVTGTDGHTPSLLDLVHQCHNHEPWLDSGLTPFVLDGVQIGFLTARVVKACIDDSGEQLRAGSPPVLRKVRFAMHHREIVPPTAPSRVCEAITFTSHFATPEARTAGLNAVAQRWRQAGTFPDPLDGWRDELYAIYGLNPQPGTRNPIAFKMERAACALFGFATFGVHLTAYTVAPTTGELKVWVPQRSSTKSTWPGYLDNSVAGGIVAGDLPMESMVRECEEEANLEPALVKKHIKQTGVLSYCYKTSKQGWIQPEVEYVYDLPLPADVVLQPKDGEVDHFELMTLAEIYDKMREGRFKANCVLVLLDFLIRHGHITAETEPGYRQIVAQLHVDLRLPGP
ncbi:hypothetical protein EX895_005279 [Sporisorium graminicola]|uniref:Nudix hydrolase domain-containing protein n=1 Tax=Sporisorium graminicola TaxID=280036 RepID=A0A4V6ET98_9BASI|nr:hypothetical protein EX895_005279 [Sporisorium graminicola]TKY85739.1 hypothetical protein EX895_005279 [Sporisorium graminicola]